MWRPHCDAVYATAGDTRGYNTGIRVEIGAAKRGSEEAGANVLSEAFAMKEIRYNT